MNSITSIEDVQEYTPSLRQLHAHGGDAADLIGLVVAPFQPSDSNLMDETMQHTFRSVDNRGRSIPFKSKSRMVEEIFKTSSKEDNNLHNKWLSRTKNIGDEITSHESKFYEEHSIRVTSLENEQINLASYDKDQHPNPVKNIFHRSYWKYKPHHFIDQVKIKKKIHKLSPRFGFSEEIEKCMHVTKEKTSLEEKYADSDRFKFE